MAKTVTILSVYSVYLTLNPRGSWIVDRECHEASDFFDKNEEKMEDAHCPALSVPHSLASAPTSFTLQYNQFVRLTGILKKNSTSVNSNSPYLIQRCRNS